MPSLNLRGRHRDPCKAIRLALAVLAGCSEERAVADAELLLVALGDVDSTYRDAYWELQTVLGTGGES